MIPSSNNRTKVFISYSHKDARYLEGLLPHLEHYERNKLIDYWADTKIKPGDNWREEIEQALASTKVAVLLISIDFLTSQFITENELPPLLASAQAKGVVILPVMLRPCKPDKNLSQFQAVNSPSMPLAKMKGYQREELWVKVTDAIRDAMDFQQAELAPPKKHQSLEMTNTIAPTKFDEMLEGFKALSSLIQRLLIVMESLDIAEPVNRVQQLKERMLTDTFKVLVMGEFKRGKTTFINAILGRKVLPSNVTPTTATITEVKWGEAPRAVVYFRTSKNNSTRKSQEVSAYQIEQYIVSNDKEASYEKLELFWPLDFCRNGIEIIDSPGLFADTEQQGITLNYLSFVDAIIFVLSCDGLLSYSEKAAISLIRNAGHKNILFVCNGINLINQEERVKLMKYCISMLSPLTERGEKNIFFVDAFSALQAHLNGDRKQLDQSGLLLVEEELKNFIAIERWHIRHLQASMELKTSIREAQRNILEKKELLSYDLEMIKERLTEAQETLGQLELKHRQILNSVAHFRFKTKKQVSEAAGDFYKNLIGNIEEWVNKYEAKQPVKMSESFSRHAAERVAEEMYNFLTEHIKDAFNSWQTSWLVPYLTNQTNKLFKEIEYESRSILINFNSMVDSRNLIYILPLLPFNISLYIQHTLNIDDLNKRIKETKGKYFERTLQDSYSVIINAIASDVDKQLSDIQDALDHELNLEFQSIQEGVNAIIATKQQSFDVELHKLSTIANELDVIDKELDSLI